MGTSLISSSCTIVPIIGRRSTLPMHAFLSAFFSWRSRSSAMKVLAGPDDRGLRLDVFLAQRLKNLTRSQIQLLNRSGGVRVDGRQDKAGYRIRGGESIELDLRALEPAPITPEQLPLQIYFEDRDLSVIE